MSKLEKIKKFIDCNWFLENNVSIKKYYKVNKKAYRFFHSKRGFMHMKISFNGKMQDCGDEYQPNTVMKYINEKTKHILELGCGQGANLYYLAIKNKDIKFTGIDLYPSIDKKLANVTLISADYHSLDKIKSNSQEIVYAFETLCYSQNKEIIFKEVSRVLKKGGVFIIFDGYSNVKEKDISLEQKELMNLVSKGMGVSEFEYYENIKNYANRNNFKEIEIKELTREILPNTDKFKNIVEKGMKFGVLFKFFCKILPREFVGNAISGYLLSEALEEKLYCYYEHIYKKEN